MAAAKNNVLIGIGGSDSLNRRAGDDGIYAGRGTDTVTGGAGSDAFGGRIDQLQGDIFTDFSAEDRLQIFDEDFNLIGADLTIVGSEMRIDTDGDGTAEATITLTNGYTGPVNNEGDPAGGPVPTVFAIQNYRLYPASGMEEADSFTVTVTRSGDIFSTATVDIQTSGDSFIDAADAADVSTSFGVVETLTFAPLEIEKTFTVTISEDTNVEADESFSIALSNPISEGLDGAGSDPRVGTDLCKDHQR